MAADNQRGAAPGGGRPGEGFSFGREGGGGGRGGRDGDRRGGKDRGKSSGPGHRILSDLSTLEKALSKTDFAAERAPLDEILKSLKQQHVRSLESLDLNARGRLITTLARVSRQPKPAKTEAPPPAEAPAETAPAAEASEAPPEVEAADAAPSEEGAAEAPAAEAAPSEAPAAEAAAPAPVVEDKTETHAEVMVRLAMIWKFLGETDRFDAAIAASGRTLSADDLQRLEAPAPAAAKEGRPERGPKGKGGKPGRDRDRGPRGERREAKERPPRPGREPLPVFPPGTDWTEQVKILEEKGRTRDAGRIHEKNNSFADAARLYEKGGDFKAALRNAAQAKDLALSKKLVGQVKADEAVAILEKANAYELLMELYVETGRFDQVARLYERARQFDQAGLAWERAGKLPQARKAFERAKDFGAVERLRTVEVERLVQRGDRFGAATILAQSGKRAEALEALSTLPTPKQYRFLEKLKMTDEAGALAKAELAKAEEEKRPSSTARWLEILGDAPGAAAAWEKAERKDKAYPLYEKMGDIPKAAALAEGAGHRENALRLYKIVGDSAAVTRVEAMPLAPVSPPSPSPEDEAEKASGE